MAILWHAADRTRKNRSQTKSLTCSTAFFKKGMLPICKTLWRWLRRPLAERPEAVIATVYTRRNCHLCHEAEQMLARHGVAVERIDIDSDAQLAARYHDRVPVVVIDGQERFFGRVDQRLLLRLLRARRQRPKDASD